jgi:catechol 2,3-dioxygenase-like lactoylglutathione lyase family enzyme
MAVKRIVANIAADQFESVKAFYCDILEMKVVMDFGWMVTLASETPSTPQVGFAHEGGSGTPVPDLSIEIDNLDEVYQRALAAGFPIEYGPVTEPWGVRRFYMRDPVGRLVNILFTAKQSDLAGVTARNLPFWQVIRLGENLTFPVIAMAILLTASHCSGAASAGDRARELGQATAAKTGSAWA